MSWDSLLKGRRARAGSPFVHTQSQLPKHTIDMSFEMLETHLLLKDGRLCGITILLDILLTLLQFETICINPLEGYQAKQEEV